MKKRILIVDDNSTNLYMLETLLKGYGFEVTSAENGEDALDKAILNPPDLIVSDILMPVMDGYNLCRQWKLHDTLKHIPFVFYTATYTGSKNEDFALSLGAERFIVKPQGPDVLMNILKEVLAENYVVKQVATKPLEEEMEVFRQYNEILFDKLEKKMLDLEIANQELRMLEERYRLSFENVTDVIYMVDKDLSIISISPSMERILGYKPQDFIGRSVSNLEHIFTPESFDRAVADIGLILKGETIPATVYQFIAKDGTIKYGEVSGSPVMQDGKILGIISVARDITNRKRAEEALRETNETLNTIVKSSPLAIIALDPDGNVSRWNPAAEEMFGWLESEALGHPLPYVSEDKRDEHLKLRDRVLRGEGFTNVEARRRKKDGSPIDISISTAPLRDSQGRVTGIMSVNADITEHKQIQEALRESEEKYRKLVKYALMLPRKSGHTVKLLYPTFGLQNQEARDTLTKNAS